MGSDCKISHKQIASTSKARLLRLMYLTDKQQHANFLPIQMIYFEKKRQVCNKKWASVKVEDKGFVISYTRPLSTIAIIARRTFLLFSVQSYCSLRQVPLVLMLLCLHCIIFDIVFSFASGLCLGGVFCTCCTIHTVSRVYAYARLSVDAQTSIF